MNWRPQTPHQQCERTYHAEGLQASIGALLETVEDLRQQLHCSERQRQQTANRLALEQRANSLWRRRFNALLSAKRRKRLVHSQQLRLFE